MAKRTVVTKPKTTNITVKPKPIKYTSPSDIQKQYGLDYSQKFAKQQADALAQSKLTGLNNQGKQIDTGIKNAQDTIGRDYFQKGLQQAQSQVNGGVNSGLAAEGNLRLGMSRQADMSKMFREAQTEKNNLASQITNVEVERKANQAQIYQDLQEKAFDKAKWQTEFNNSNSKWETEFNRNQAIDNRNFTYQQGRDKVGDAQWDKSFNYQKGRDKATDSQWDKSFTYQKGRDKVGDTQWDKQFGFQKSQFKTEQEWRKYEFSHMSKSEKTALDWAKKQYGEDAAWRLYEMEYNGNKALSQNQATIDGYSAMDFLP
ncbi:MULTISPECIES: hypothetical protein [unclassified Peribacillus]|uniref:hypothetical protein n=1 Tax=unclassified Peribacillus TaxID=2675266 RepID=UPI003672814A